MTRDEFKDRLAIQLVPLFTQLMMKPAAQQVLSVNNDPTKMSAVMPEPQIVAAHVYGYCEGVAQIRDQHTVLLERARKELRQKKKDAARMELVRAQDKGPLQ